MGLLELTPVRSTCRSIYALVEPFHSFPRVDLRVGRASFWRITVTRFWFSQNSGFISCEISFRKNSENKIVRRNCIQNPWTTSQWGKLLSLNTRALQNCYSIYLDEIKKGIDLELAHFSPLIKKPGVSKPIVELHLLSMIFPDRKFGVGWECDKCGELKIPTF